MISPYLELESKHQQYKSKLLVDIRSLSEVYTVNTTLQLKFVNPTDKPSPQIILFESEKAAVNAYNKTVRLMKKYRKEYGFENDKQ